MKTPVYQIIAQNIRNGVLPPDFSLPEAGSDPAAVRFAPGAMDGITIYHMQPRELDAEGIKQMAEAFRTVSDGKFQEAEELFAKWTEKHRAVSVINIMRRYIIDHENELNINYIFRLGIHMIRNSANIECVKIGLELLFLFDISDDILQNFICVLGLYNEFTLFAAWDMQTWDDGNRYIFDLAKKVHGWGRIHAVNLLDPETDEIKHWLLTEGTVNNVENSYSSLTCWIKSGAEKILFGDPSIEEFKGIALLLDGLITEGPVPGISAIENNEKILLRFLEISHNYPLCDSEYEVISAVYDWAGGFEEPKAEIIKACRELLPDLSV